MKTPRRALPLIAAGILVAGTLGGPGAETVAAAGGGTGNGTPGPIVYARNIGWAQRLYTLVPGGTPELIPGTDGARSARWSPDGRVIAFTRESSAVLLVNPDGSGLRELFTAVEGEMYGEPIWSPDGRRLAFGVLPSGAGEYRLEVADSLDGAREIFPTQMAYVTDWLPDGSFLGGVTRQAEDGGMSSEDLAVTTPDGVTTYLTDTPTRSEGVPRLSPDGTRITFLESKVSESGIRWAVAVMNRDGTGRKILADIGSELTWPSWSPNSTEILYGTTPTAIKVDGSSKRRLTDAIGGQDGLDWAPLSGTVTPLAATSAASSDIASTDLGIRGLALPDPSTKATATVSATTIWPTRDGYRDTLRISQRMREPARSTIKAYNRYGTLVLSRSFGYRTGSFSYWWNGRTSAGSVLRPGRYKIVTTARDLAGNRLSKTFYVTLYRGYP